MSRPCQSCEMLSINGVPCHETGCPDAWIGQPTRCFECGCDFVPEESPFRGMICPDCANPEPFEPEPSEEAQEGEHCSACHSGTCVADTCDTCGERHCPACSPCEEA